MSEPGSPGRAARRFADLRVRLLSAAGLLVLGIVAVWFGGRVFEAVTVLMAGAMTWELARLGNATRPGLCLVIAVATAAGLVGAAEPLFRTDPALFEWHWQPEYAVLLLGPALFFVTPRRDKLLAVVWTCLVELACLELINLRQISPAMVLWPMGLIVASDMAGYFLGRLIGGPKFWPALSPKKTWSGTVAGWLAAVVWSFAIGPYMGVDTLWLALTAPIFALAGQLADLFESWMKRRAGVKDSSNLIPGHGGVMDRFDAITGAAALGLALEWLRAGFGG